jgi:5S rRNA maturation endonuclease (ribonuclease M5)
MIIPWYVDKKLIGATGRAINPDPNIPKIVAYFGLRKELALYVPNRVLSANKPLILVEGEIDAIRVFQLGYSNVAALAFGRFTKAQQKIVTTLGVETVVLFFDSDDAGRRLTEFTRSVLCDYCQIAEVHYPAVNRKQDPASMTDRQLRLLLNSTLNQPKFQLKF